MTSSTSLSYEVYSHTITLMDNLKRQCTCSKCNGKFVNIKTFRAHSKKIHNTHAEISDTHREQPEIVRESKELLKKTLILNQSLHEGTNRTVKDAIAEHLFIFSSNNGMSKTALSQYLYHEKCVLPQPNNLPSTYCEAVTIIQPYLMPIEKFKCCTNDCKIFPISSTILACPDCNESLVFSNNRNKKTFQYMPIVPRIVRWYGTRNLAKILYANKLNTTGRLSSYTDGNIFRQQMTDGVFKDQQQQNCVPLALFADGVNPNKNQTVQKSIWPLIITWITLPQEMRYILGPMMLAGIVPGYGRKEPKSLDPYINVLVDELLSNIECNLYDAYTDAPVNVKIALLQYLCDIPAFSKLLHCSGQAAIRACFFCKDTGVHSSSVNKVLHISNREFLPTDSPFRKGKTLFAKKTEEVAPKPQAYSREEEMEIRKEYDKKKNNNQKCKLQKETGFKGIHPLHRLPYFDRVHQMQPDGMHTLADVISNILDLITGKSDGPKVRQCEKDYNRFKETWPKRPSLSTIECERPSKQAKKSSVDTAVPEPTPKAPPLPAAPWLLTKQDVKLADNRAKSVKYPKGFDYTPADHFTRAWTLRTMHGKQQFVTKNIAAWCIRGLLAKPQEETLFNLFEVIKRLTQPSYTTEQLQGLIEDTSTAVVLLERDFPLTLQNITTHLLHHIPEGYEDYGPLYDRWLYPLERANSWVTRQILQHGHEESTVMQTYRIYDWSSHNILSGEIINYSRQTSLCRLAEKVNSIHHQDISTASTKRFILQSEDLSILKDNYNNIYDQNYELFDIDPVVTYLKFSLRQDAELKRQIFFSTTEHQTTASRSHDYCVSVSHRTNRRFGTISKIFKHNHLDKATMWVKLEMFPIPEQSGLFLVTDDRKIDTHIFSFDKISNPVVFASEDNKIWFLNV
ncbi:uncharacterized protein LOC143055256 [Mytilus galloprovincialis]|uniref:uncharacterized protein LOC143055256 n=1 Tax=Mytilus galloprovincialis TaxID=29158 RepID=UPI003F7C73C8